MGETFERDWGVFGVGFWEASGVFEVVFWGDAIAWEGDGVGVVTALIMGKRLQLPRVRAMPVQPAHPKQVKTMVSRTERR